MTLTLFLILAPYGAFASLMLVVSATVSLAAAAVICLATITIDVVRGRTIKLLPAASAVVFAGTAVYLNVFDPSLGSSKVRLAVDAGIFAISIGSMLIRYPFTLHMRWNRSLPRPRPCRASCAPITSSPLPGLWLRC